MVGQYAISCHYNKKILSIYLLYILSIYKKTRFDKEIGNTSRSPCVWVKSTPNVRSVRESGNTPDPIGWLNIKPDVSSVRESGKTPSDKGRQ